MPRIPTVISQQRPGGQATTVPLGATADHKNTTDAEDARDARGMVVVSLLPQHSKAAVYLKAHWRRHRSGCWRHPERFCFYCSSSPACL